MSTIIFNIHDKIEEAAEEFLLNNVNTFKSTVAGPAGIDGEQGARGKQGVSVHHVTPTNTTDPEGDFSTVGEVDTYTIYGDADELLNLGHIDVRNGQKGDQGERGLQGDIGLTPVYEFALVGGDLEANIVGYTEAVDTIEWSS